MKKTIFLLFLLLFISASKAMAENDFAVILHNKYDFEQNGTASVAKNYELLNLTTASYPSVYILSVPSDFYELVAFDSAGKIEPEISEQDNRKLVQLVFNEKNIGINKSLNFAVSFKTKSYFLPEEEKIIIPSAEEDVSYLAYTAEVNLPDLWQKNLKVRPYSKKKLSWTAEELNQQPIEIQISKNQDEEKTALANVKDTKLDNSDYFNLLYGVILGIIITFIIYYLVRNFYKK